MSAVRSARALVSLVAVVVVLGSCGAPEGDVFVRRSAFDGSVPPASSTTALEDDTGEELDVGVSISEDGDLVLVDVDCSAPLIMRAGVARVEELGEISWLGGSPPGRILVVRNDPEGLSAGSEPPGLVVGELPGDAPVVLDLAIPFAPFGFMAGELSPDVVLTADGVRHAMEEYSGPCLRGGSDWWGVQLLDDGHLEVVSMACESLLAGGFVVTVDEQPRLTWLSGFVDDLLNKGVEEPEGDLESVQALELSPESNSATPAPPVEAYDFSGLAPEARVRVEQLGGYFVLVQRGDLQEGTVVTGVDSVPRDEVERRCEAGTDGRGDGSGTSE